MNVAQLKVTRQSRVLRAGRSFPRLNERGSIEGSVPLTRLTCCLWFPRLNERGSIEGLRVTHNYAR